MTPKKIVRDLSDSALGHCAIEALYWRRKGVLSGGMLRRVADRFVGESGVAESEAPRLADVLVIEEAALRFAKSLQQGAELNHLEGVENGAHHRRQ